MARLMIVPLEALGDAVLIVSQQAGFELIGYVTISTFAAMMHAEVSGNECIALVERNLTQFEGIILRKAQTNDDARHIPFVEITERDLSSVDIDLTRRHRLH